MTAASMTSSSGSGLGDPTTAGLLAELTSTGDAVRGRGWLSPGLGPESGGLGLLDATDSPLSALSAAGFGDLRQLVSFLDEPLKQLAGDSGSVSSAAQGFQGSGENLASLAESYRASGIEQTSTWLGGAAEGYRGAAARNADGIAALGQAASAVGSAISGAGEAVAQTLQGVRQDITEAVAQMLPIMTQARARAAATNGASLAEAIIVCVRIAEEYGRRIAARMRALLSSAQNLKSVVEKTMQTVDAVKQALQQSGEAAAGGESSGDDSSASETTGSEATGGDESGPGWADAAAGTSDQTSQSGFADAAAGPSTAESSSGGTSTANSSVRPGGTSLPSTPATVAPQSLGSGTSLAGGLSRTPAGTGGGATSGAGPRRGTPTNLRGVGGDSVDSGGLLAAGAGATTASASSAAGNRMLGGGMMGAPGGHREDDKEHQSPEWLRENSGLFDPDAPVAPAVIDAPLDPDDEDMSHGDVTPGGPESVATRQDSEAPPVKMEWRLGENGELELVPAPDQPKGK